MLRTRFHQLEHVRLLGAAVGAHVVVDVKGDNERCFGCSRAPTAAAMCASAVLSAPPDSATARRRGMRLCSPKSRTSCTPL
jgi:hypothetical protein